MTTLTLNAPEKKPEAGRFLLLAFAILLFGLVVGFAVRAALHANPNQVPLRPCLSCPSCNCPKTLGSVKCLCPK